MHGSGWWSYIRYDEEQDRLDLTPRLLQRVAAYARPYLPSIGLMLLTILISTLLSLVPPLLYRDLIDHALPQRDLARLNLLALGMIGIPLLSGLVGVAQRYLSAAVGEGVIFDLRRALFEHMQRMSLRFFTHTHSGELVSRLNNDVIGAQRAVSSTLVSLVSNVIAVAGTLAIMVSLDWRLTLIGVAIFPLFILPARRLGRVLRKVTRDSLKLNAEMNVVMNETLNVSGALLVKIFGRSADENARFADRAAAVRDVGIRSAVLGRWFFLGLGLAEAVGTAVVFWTGGFLVLQQELTVGTIVAFGAYLTQFYSPVSSLTNARVDLATSLVSFERVFEVLDLPVEIGDQPGAIELSRVQGSVRFEDVWFRYEAADNRTVALSSVKRWDTASMAREQTKSGSTNGRTGTRRPGPGVSTDSEMGDESGEGVIPQRTWAVEGITFEVAPGQLAALVGPSGAGKTTITYLLPRLYDVTKGRILIDGHDVRDVTLTSLSQQIGIVTQETYLFHDTIRANLLYAKPDATEADIRQACQTANIHDFIVGLPDGYDTVVGERGYRLSGGEKQRIAIARVVLKDPRILILDEATSHLDSQSEALIQAALERIMRGRTSLVIAHRLSTVLAADVILVMDQGRLVEQGTHAELLRKEGLYASLYRTQFRASAGTAQHVTQSTA